MAEQLKNVSVCRCRGCWRHLSEADHIQICPSCAVGVHCHPEGEWTPSEHRQWRINTVVKCLRDVEQSLADGHYAAATRLLQAARRCLEQEVR